MAGDPGACVLAPGCPGPRPLTAAASADLTGDTEHVLGVQPAADRGARAPGRPLRDSRNDSSGRARAPVEEAAGRRMTAITSVVRPARPFRLPYWTAMAGPPVISSVLPATPAPAFWLKCIVAVACGWIATMPAAPTPAGSVAGAL